MKTTKTKEQKTIERIVNRLDNHAESINAHDFVITHRALAVLAVRTIGVAATLTLFRALSREMGLNGLTGVGGDEPKNGVILKRLGICENWGDWSLPKGKP